MPDEWQVRPVAGALPPPPPALPLIDTPIGAIPAPRSGFSIRELRTYALTLAAEDFRRQLGPFVLVQKPPAPVVARLAAELGVGATGDRFSNAQSTELFVALMMEFDYLQVAALPPLAGDDELMIGRLPDCELVIDDPSVSKRHAVLRWDSRLARCRVCDLRSTNGTSVNGLTLAGREAPLVDGDLLMFADATYLFLTSESLRTRLLQRVVPLPRARG